MTVIKPLIPTCPECGQHFFLPKYPRWKTGKPSSGWVCIFCEASGEGDEPTKAS